MKNLLSKISLKAVAIGAGLNLGGTIAATFIWAMLFAIYLSTSTNHSISSKEMAALLQNDKFFSATNLIIGSGFSILGGYVAAHIAKKHVLLNAALTSILCILLTLMGGKHIILLIAANIFLSFLGGYIYLYKNGRKGDETSTSTT